ncbi:MAG: DUF4232 domain-containing protein [Actinomycetes bacterium]
MRRTVIGFALTCLLLLGTDACSSNSDNASTDRSSSTTQTTAAPATTTTMSNSASSTHCATTQLKGGLGDSQSGAGQRYTVLVLTNTGNRACDLRGFPGVSLVDANGKQIGEPAAREGSEGPTVSLPPGASASAILRTSAAGMGAPCEPTSAQIRVYPPDNTASLIVASAYSACGGFRVTTLVAGTAGN